jgi:hypothetical protein
VRASLLGLRMTRMIRAFWLRSLGAQLRSHPLFGAPLSRVRVEA